MAHEVVALVVGAEDFPAIPADRFVGGNPGRVIRYVTRECA
jgi:hypothetical protein